MKLLKDFLMTFLIRERDGNASGIFWCNNSYALGPAINKRDIENFFIISLCLLPFGKCWLFLYALVKSCCSTGIENSMVLLSWQFSSIKPESDGLLQTVSPLFLLQLKNNLLINFDQDQISRIFSFMTVVWPI